MRKYQELKQIHTSQRKERESKSFYNIRAMEITFSFSFFSFNGCSNCECNDCVRALVEGKRNKETVKAPSLSKKGSV